MKAYIYYYLGKNFSEEDIHRLRKELSQTDIEQTTKDEILIKISAPFEKVYELAKNLTNRLKKMLGEEVQLNRIICFRDQ